MVGTETVLTNTVFRDEKSIWNLAARSGPKIKNDSLMNGEVVANFANKLKRNSKKLLSGLMLAGALGATGAVGAASMDVLNFENANLDSPFLMNGDHVQFGNFFVETYTGSGDGFAAVLFDGNDAGQCSLKCPVNNKTNYLGVLDDSYFFFGMNDGSDMHVTGLSASFIAADQTTLPAVAGILQLIGFDVNGNQITSALQVPLSGFSTAGSLNFTNFSLPASFSNVAVNAVAVLGYACNAAGSCSRTSGLANFAIDNIKLPEPTSLALFGLAAAGLAAARRRRAA